MLLVRLGDGGGKSVFPQPCPIIGHCLVECLRIALRFTGLLSVEGAAHGRIKAYRFRRLPHPPDTTQSGRRGFFPAFTHELGARLGGRNHHQVRATGHGLQGTFNQKQIPSDLALRLVIHLEEILDHMRDTGKALHSLVALRQQL